MPADRRGDPLDPLRRHPQRVGNLGVSVAPSRMAMSVNAIGKRGGGGGDVAAFDDHFPNLSNAR